MIIIDNIVKSIRGTGGISILFENLVSRMERENIPHITSGYNFNADCKEIRTARMAERYRKARIDKNLDTPQAVFHSTYYRVPNAKHVKVITTVHDFTYERIIGGFRRVVHSTQKGFAISRSDHVICVSENTKRDLLDYFPKISDSKITVVPNGVSEGFYPLQVSRPRTAVIFVGQRAGYKNFSAVVEALSEMDHIELECVGGGPFSKAELCHLESKLPSRFRHLGFISEAELNAAYNRAVCLVYPSLYEGFGIPVLEAFKAGCPVVATNSSSIPEVAGGLAFLVDDGTADELRGAIERAISEGRNPNRIKRGIARAQQFTWDATFDRTMKVYERELGYSLYTPAT